MPTIALTDGLRAEYQQCFESCEPRNDARGSVAALLDAMLGARERYEAVGATIGCPWWVVGVIHCLESSARFTRHLHNGDPLTARTVRVPSGHPRTGEPPFTWEQSAVDALQLRRLDRWTDWSLPGALYQIEAYNGWGYRLYHSHVRSPYLWGGSNHYTSGKYVSDGKWSDTAVSAQVGAAVLIRRLAELGRIDIVPQAGGRRMEHVIVTFPTKRLVYIDGEENGYTNDVLRVDAGTHVFELANKANFRPASRKITVKDTSVLEPLEVEFFRIDDE